MYNYTLDELILLSEKHPIIVFDGVCNLCNGFVQWLIKQDTSEKFRYATLQSINGAALYKKSGTKEDTVLLVDQGISYTLSDVALRSMTILGGGWKIISWLRIAPRIIRDTVYKWIARNRYRWFGKKEVCMVPNKEMRKLFL